MGWYRRKSGAVVIAVRLTPKADCEAFAGIAVLSDGSEVLQARVRAVPADGAANAALVRLMAAELRVPKSSIEIVAGQTQRLKHVSVAGSSGDLARVLDEPARQMTPQRPQA